MTQPPKMAQPSEVGRARFDRLVDELKNELDIVGASMFGMPSIKRRDGKAFAGLYGEDMVFKLDGEAHMAALALEGSHLFEPMAGQTHEGLGAGPAEPRDPVGGSREKG